MKVISNLERTSSVLVSAALVASIFAIAAVIFASPPGLAQEAYALGGASFD